ncbi:MAG: 50S ribosomal protein L23 [Marinirhabdus sp.]
MDILIKPIITEKASKEAERFNRYRFVVNKKANKIEIKTAVEKAYGISVDKVRTMNVRPDRRSRNTKKGLQTGKTSGYKKAVVQVAEGDTIDFYSNM